MKFSLGLHISSPVRVWGFVMVVTLIAITVSISATVLSLLIAGIYQNLIAYLIAISVPAISVPPVAYLIAHYAYRLSLAHQALFQLAHTDELTGLANRRHFFAQGSQQLDEDKAADQPTALMLLDADRFKQINDSAGHAAGDAALCFLAQTLRACIEPGDLVARLGGDEFAILRPAATKAEMTCLATQINHQLAQNAFFYNGVPMWLSVSIGIADTRQATSFEQLLRASDVALYQKKLGDAMHFSSDVSCKQSLIKPASINLGQGYHLQQGGLLR